jgi:uncharacterized protein
MGSSPPVFDTIEPTASPEDLEEGPQVPAGVGPSERPMRPEQTQPNPTRRKPTRRKPGRSKAKTTAHRLTRTIHVYTSMVCFLVVLFFSATGLTLNHPTWTLGGNGSRATVSGTLPPDWKVGDTIDWLNTAEFLRATHGLRGHVDEHDASSTTASITFKAPGYSADAFIQVDKGTYDLTVEAQGLLGVMNDLHKGRDSSSPWKWLIDVAAIFLVVISLTGLLLQFFLRKRRFRALSVAVVGAVAAAILSWLTLK